MPKQFCIYITTNKRNTVLYTGVTSDLSRRIFEHKQKLIPGFTSKYNVNKLVYFETCDNAIASFEREKQIKAGSRRRKIELIESINPDWEDLSDYVYN